MGRLTPLLEDMWKKAVLMGVQKKKETPETLDAKLIQNFALSFKPYGYHSEAQKILEFEPSNMSYVEFLMLEGRIQMPNPYREVIMNTQLPFPGIVQTPYL